MINREDLLSGTRPEIKNRILITEKENFQGYEIMDYKGLVWGISRRSKDLVQDIFMGLKNLTGGELSSYTQLSYESRQKAMDRLMESAQKLGANAVINFRFEINNDYGGNAEVVAYGNAVKIRPIQNYVPMGGLGNILTEFVDYYSGGKIIDTTSPVAQIVEAKGLKFVVCPHCQMKYKVDIDETGKVHIVNFNDEDTKEAGMQIFCVNCGTKFTLPNS